MSSKPNPYGTDRFSTYYGDGVSKSYSKLKSICFHRMTYSNLSHAESILYPDTAIIFLALVFKLKFILSIIVIAYVCYFG
jgi:hypothetical protein